MNYFYIKNNITKKTKFKAKYMEKLRILISSLIIIASFATFYMSRLFLIIGSSSNYYHGPDFAILYPIGILNLISGGFCLAGGFFYIKNKWFKFSIFGLVLMLISGLLIPLLLPIFSLLTFTGWVFGSPMILFSLVILILIWFTKRNETQTAKTLEKIGGTLLILSVPFTIYFSYVILTGHFYLADPFYMFNFMSISGGGFMLPTISGGEYLGILNFITAGFCLFGGIAFLKNQNITLFILSVDILLLSGLMSALIFLIKGSGFIGFFFGIPQLFLSTACFCLIGMIKFQNKQSKNLNKIETN